MTQYDFEYQTPTYEYQILTWLNCEVRGELGVKVVIKLKCQVCTKSRDRIIGRRNLSDIWMNGADSVQPTSILVHAKSDQHEHAINLLKREQAKAQGVKHSFICGNCTVICFFV